MYTHGNSHIIPVVIGSTDKTVQVSKHLQEKGFWVLPIRPPTVPEGTGRLRLSITYHHTQAQLDALEKTLTEVLSSNDLIYPRPRETGLKA